MFKVISRARCSHCGGSVICDANLLPKIKPTCLSCSRELQGGLAFRSGRDGGYLFNPWCAEKRNGHYYLPLAKHREYKPSVGELIEVMSSAPNAPVVE